MNDAKLRTVTFDDGIEVPGLRGAVKIARIREQLDAERAARALASPPQRRHAEYVVSAPYSIQMRCSMRTSSHA